MNLFSKKKKKEKAVEGDNLKTGSAALPKQGEVKTKQVSSAKAKNKNNKPFTDGLVSVKDIVAPSAVEVDFNHMRINNRYYRTLFAAGYPRFVSMNWLSTLINFDHSLNVSMYVYPTDGKEILDDLRRKIAEMEAELSTDLQRGKVINPSTKAKLEDALTLQEDLVKGEERFFQFGLYVTISAESKEELDQVTKALESSLGALLIITKKTTLQMEEGFKSSLPICQDTISVTRNMDTTSLASTFPFVSSDLSDDKGIMYGINEHNGSLVIFDRFEMENYNSVIFATSGAGKSYLVKLEALRSLMFGSEVLVIDPENEYENLCESVGGQYVAFGYDEKSKINPFELSSFKEGGENELTRKILSLHALFKIVMGEMNPEEEAILDRALMDSYKMKGITPDPETQDKEPPLMEDLYKALIGREEDMAKSLAARLERFIKGSMMGIFNSQSTVDLNNKFVVFGIKNLEESLRPIAMHIILEYIWNRVRKDMKKRLLIVDEAWLMMQHKDSATFLYGITKRARKYFLGVTTVTQDVEDFLNADKGKAIVTNSALRILLKQHTAAIDKLSEVFYLSEGEKQLLLSADVGEGIFFAGQNHVAIRVIASEEEHDLITSKPEDLLRIKEERRKREIEKEGRMKDSEQKRLELVKEKAALENRSANMEESEVTPVSGPSMDLLGNSEKKKEPEMVEEKVVVPTTPPVSPVEKTEEIPIIEMPSPVKEVEGPPVKIPEPVATEGLNVSPAPTVSTEEEKPIEDDQTTLALEKKIAGLEEEETKRIKEAEEKEKVREMGGRDVGSGVGGLAKNKDLFTGTGTRGGIKGGGDVYKAKTDPVAEMKKKLIAEPAGKTNVSDEEVDNLAEVVVNKAEEVKSVETLTAPVSEKENKAGSGKPVTELQGGIKQNPIPAGVKPVEVNPVAPVKKVDEKKPVVAKSKDDGNKGGFNYSKIAQEVWGEDGDNNVGQNGKAKENKPVAGGGKKADSKTETGKIKSYEDLF